MIVMTRRLMGEHGLLCEVCGAPAVLMLNGFAPCCSGAECHQVIDEKHAAAREAKSA